MPHQRLLTTILTTTIAAVVLQQTHAAPPGRVVIRQVSNEDGPRLYFPNQVGTEQAEEQPALFQAETISRPIPQPVAQPVSQTRLKVPTGTQPAAPIPYTAGNRPVQAAPLQTAKGHRPSYYPQPVYNTTLPNQGQPHINAPLYPTPLPNVPYQVGTTMITNQALAPHEMLYAHKYRALYGPYYYRVRGGWIVTPRGVYSHESWKMLGTEVKVDYKDHYPWYSLFMPPK